MALIPAWEMDENECMCHRSVDSIWTDELNVRSSDDMVSSDATRNLITSSLRRSCDQINFTLISTCTICIEDINIYNRILHTA